MEDVDVQVVVSGSKRKRRGCHVVCGVVARKEVK